MVVNNMQHMVVNNMQHMVVNNMQYMVVNNVQHTVVNNNDKMISNTAEAQTTSLVNHLIHPMLTRFTISCIVTFLNSHHVGDLKDYF